MISFWVSLAKTTLGEVSKYGIISGWYFPVFGLNTERYSVSLRIQSKCRKIPTRNNSVFGHFSRSATIGKLKLFALSIISIDREWHTKYELHKNPFKLNLTLSSMVLTPQNS